ncbi:TPA: hypothetical protein O7P91_004456 [Escherichia coli]|nr:hypothetical protein [Escherichia coli]
MAGPSENHHGVVSLLLAWQWAYGWELENMKRRKARSASQWQTMRLQGAHLLSRYALNKTNDLTILKDRCFNHVYRETDNSSKAAYSQVQTVPSHDAQQDEVTTQASYPRRRPTRTPRTVPNSNGMLPTTR